MCWAGRTRCQLHNCMLAFINCACCQRGSGFTAPGAHYGTHSVLTLQQAPTQSLSIPLDRILPTHTRCSMSGHMLRTH
jgi:hypothetical protein